MKTLMETIIETVIDRRGNEYLADAIVFNLVEWGAIPEDEGATFADVWLSISSGDKWYDEEGEDV